ncbi:MAG TPA: winged helix-turn-helix domain-containing protein [Pyrinomonadaceae bacterium]|nr:winged helix-turn-helix domain-containing protein [Pyrinomonadaceae bacterium]
MDKPSRQKSYEFADFRVDADNRMLYRRGKEIQLAPKAVETLLALIERRGEIVSKGTLIDAVWPETVVEESNLFLYLSVLRKTLGKQTNGDQWIETLRRRGYRFNGDIRLIETPAEGNAHTGHDLEALVSDPVPSFSPPEERAELLDSGVKGAERESRSSRPARPRPWLWGIPAAVALVAVLAFTFQYFAPRPPITSVAVLPFANESGDPELDYLAASMTSTLIGKLAILPNFQVKSKAAVYGRYKGANIHPKEVGQALGVRAVLFGRLTKRENDTALNLELVDTETENSLWNHTYSREFANLAAIDGRVARDIARELNIDLSPELERRLGRNYTTNAEAYRLYSKGRVHLRRLTRQEVEIAIEHMKKAIEIDPTYALAYAGLAESYRSLCVGAEVDPRESCHLSKEAALKAIEIDNGLAEGHAALAYMKIFYDWDFKEAEKLILRALELDPNSAQAHFAYGELVSRIVGMEASFPHRERARELEPLSPMLNAFSAGVDRDPNQALERVRIAIEIDPNFYASYVFAGGIYRRNKMNAEAFEAFRMAKKLAPEQTWSDAIGLVPLLVETGRREEAQQILDEMLLLSKTRSVSPGNIAMAYKALGRKNEAFDWLEKAYQLRDPRIAMIKTLPIWQDMHSEPRFQDLLRRVGF